MRANAGLGMRPNTGLGMRPNTGLGMRANAGLGMSPNTHLVLLTFASLRYKTGISFTIGRTGGDAILEMLAPSLCGN